MQSHSIPQLLHTWFEFLCPIFRAEKELEKEEADLYRSKDDILHQSQRLTASFLEQKGELEGSTRRAEERLRTAESKLVALKEELDAARCVPHSIRGQVPWSADGCHHVSVW